MTDCHTSELTPEKEKMIRDEVKNKGLINTWYVELLLDEIDRLRELVKK